jgi:hypothetical protein
VDIDRMAQNMNTISFRIQWKSKGRGRGTRVELPTIQDQHACNFEGYDAIFHNRNSKAKKANHQTRNA